MLEQDWILFNTARPVKGDFLFAAFMIVLIVLPLSVAGGFRLHRQGTAPDAAEFRHAVHRPGVPRSLADDRDHRHYLGGDLPPCRRSDRLAGVAHRHAGAADHPRAGDGVLCHPAVSRRGRLGIAGGAQQRPLEPALSLSYRRRRSTVRHLFTDRADLRDFLLHVPVRLCAGRQRARQHAGRTGRRVRHSRRQGVDYGAARDDSAGAAGAGRRRADRVPAGDDAVRIACDPGAAGRLPHHDDENLEPRSSIRRSSNSPPPPPCRCCC